MHPHQAVQLVAVRLNMRQNIFDRYRTFSRGGSYQWMSEQGSNAKDRNTLLRSFLTGVALSACILHTLEIAPGSVADRCCSNRMFRPSVHPSFISSPRSVVTRSEASGSASANAIMTPIRRIWSDCCARAAIGHATAAPLSSADHRIGSRE